MDKLNDIFSFVSKFFQWYFIVMPWEQAIFIRAGKGHKVLEYGIYFKIPFIDRVYIQTKRKRMVNCPIQTVTTKDGHALTITAGVMYSIKDIFKVYNTLYHPETTLINTVMAEISQYVSSSDKINVTPANVEKAVSEKLAKIVSEWGLDEAVARINNYAFVKTFRIIQDTTQFYHENLSMGHTDEKNR